MYDRKDILPDGFMYVATRLIRRRVTPTATVDIAYTDSFWGLCRWHLTIDTLTCSCCVG
jgi:hypothetical protein